MNSAVHHIVEQGRGVLRFGADAIHSVANSVVMPKALHEKITGLYNSGAKAFPLMSQGELGKFKLFRHWVESKDWEGQMKIGWAVYDHVMEHGNLDRFDPFILGLAK